MATINNRLGRATKWGVLFESEMSADAIVVGIGCNRSDEPPNVGHTAGGQPSMRLPSPEPAVTNSMPA
jgi:biotin-(acetyl-CoA carboxylase) ligase